MPPNAAEIIRWACSLAMRIGSGRSGVNGGEGFFWAMAPSGSRQLRRSAMKRAAARRVSAFAANGASAARSLRPGQQKSRILAQMAAGMG